MQKEKNIIKCEICQKDRVVKGRLSLKICRSCVSAKKRMLVKKNLIDYKGGKCEICGYNKSNRALTFHHINPDIKEFEISGNYCLSIETLKKEVDKCQLLCNNCHMEIHEKMDESRLFDFWDRIKKHKKERDKKKIINIDCQFCGKEYKPEDNKKRKHFCSVSCRAQSQRKVERPSKEQLDKDILEIPYTKIGKKYGVSDNTIRKWVLYYKKLNNL